MKNPNIPSNAEHASYISPATQGRLRRLGQLTGAVVLSGLLLDASGARAQEADPTPDPNARFTTEVVGTSANIRDGANGDRTTITLENGERLSTLSRGNQLVVSRAGESGNYEWAQIWSVDGVEVSENTPAFVAIESTDGSLILLGELTPEADPVAIPEPAPEAPTESPNEEAPVSPTEAPVMLNEPQITGTPESSAEEIMSRKYDSEIGGYTVERDGMTLVYREGLQRVEMVHILPRDADGNIIMSDLEGEGPVGDAVIADRYVTTNGLGTITLEAPAEWEGLSYPEQNNALSFTNTPEAKQNLENGLNTFWLTMYQRAFGVDAAQAAEMLANDEVIEIHWTSNANMALIRDTITPDIERVLQVRPSQGVSFVVTPSAIPFHFDAYEVMPYPMIAPTAFYERNENDIAEGLLPPADTFGFDASPEGRLIIYTENEAYDPAYDSISLGYQIVGALRHAYDFVGEDGNSATIDELYLTSTRKPADMVELGVAMGIGDMSWTNPDYYPADLNAPIYTTATPFQVEADAPYVRAGE